MCWPWHSLRCRGAALVALSHSSSNPAMPSMIWQNVMYIMKDIRRHVDAMAKCSTQNERSYVDVMAQCNTHNGRHI